MRGGLAMTLGAKLRKELVDQPAHVALGWAAFAGVALLAASLGASAPAFWGASGGVLVVYGRELWQRRDRGGLVAAIRAQCAGLWTHVDVAFGAIGVGLGHVAWLRLFGG